MEIYVKPAKKASMADRDRIYLEDIAEVFAAPELMARAKRVKLLDIDRAKKDSYLVSVIDIIEALDKTLPGHTVSNVGETETLIDYKPRKSKDNRLWRWARAGFISAVIFMGAATAIMSFHTDAEIPKVFQNYYRIFFGETKESPLIIYLPYSLGLAAGIVIFFNHFMGKKVTDDPTPIEVEISLYEADVSDTKLDALNTERIRNRGKGK